MIVIGGKIASLFTKFTFREFYHFFVNKNKQENSCDFHGLINFGRQVEMEKKSPIWG